MEYPAPRRMCGRPALLAAFFVEVAGTAGHPFPAGCHLPPCHQFTVWKFGRNALSVSMILLHIANDHNTGCCHLAVTVFAVSSTTSPTRQTVSTGSPSMTIHATAPRAPVAPRLVLSLSLLNRDRQRANLVALGAFLLQMVTAPLAPTAPLAHLGSASQLTVLLLVRTPTHHTRCCSHTPSPSPSSSSSAITITISYTTPPPPPLSASPSISAHQ
ncbi:hypothetical protein K461DRAFT_51304 [Myriangium duriaei CBS 260.36]|uniref:Uncharacterized protein n=1 Tax=Myriangium duriaei CBS 260.36 TaxID=1168546 RepID=A0A9P4IUD5_9PEZI|nr:hypothetical protein K461DRAFT_51304 [Myriangium duriaei CBS 260.36]